MANRMVASKIEGRMVLSFGPHFESAQLCNVWTPSGGAGRVLSFSKKANPSCASASLHAVQWGGRHWDEQSLDFAFLLALLREECFLATNYVCFLQPDWHSHVNHSICCLVTHHAFGLRLASLKTLMMTPTNPK